VLISDIDITDEYYDASKPFRADAKKANSTAVRFPTIPNLLTGKAFIDF
jgi:hypothetical protein